MCAFMCVTLTRLVLGVIYSFIYDWSMLRECVCHGTYVEI